MWETVRADDVHLSHDMHCPRCGHPIHTFLACSPDCACAPVIMPGADGPAAA